MDNIKNTILKTNNTGKFTTTTTKFAKFLKVNENCVFDILNTLVSESFLDYRLIGDDLAMQIINQECFKIELQKVKQSNIIICVRCRYCYNKRFSSQVIDGVKHKQVTCYCSKKQMPICEKITCDKFENKFY